MFTIQQVVGTLQGLHNTASLSHVTQNTLTWLVFAVHGLWGLHSTASLTHVSHNTLTWLVFAVQWVVVLSLIHI